MLDMNYIEFTIQMGRDVEFRARMSLALDLVMSYGRRWKARHQITVMT